ncbi:MAG: hypothetical protein K2N84_02910 [Clostridia bacterium]|nr:hypothetical protein [Clostridia bacterium]MDE7296196.1 hypothetical protein [Clostridia bacterium]
MEKDVKRQENTIKKQVPLRLSSTLFAELSRWAEDDFRSLNGQIEYLLTECVKQKRKKTQ